MERSQILDAMGELKLYGMRGAYDEIVATAVKRQHEPQRVVGDLLGPEISEKQARSIKYQMTIAKLPLAKDIDDFDFDAAVVNETLVRDLAGGGFIEQQRNVVLIGGTGTGKSHAAIAIARACIRRGARGRFFNVVDLVNKLEAETRAGRQGRIADHLYRLDFVVLDEILAPVPDVEPLKRGKLSVERLVGELARKLAIVHEAALEAFILLIATFGQSGLLSGAQCGAKRVPVGRGGKWKNTGGTVHHLNVRYCRVILRSSVRAISGIRASATGLIWTPIAGQNCRPIDRDGRWTLKRGRRKRKPDGTLMMEIATLVYGYKSHVGVAVTGSSAPGR